MIFSESRGSSPGAGFFGIMLYSIASAFRSNRMAARTNPVPKLIALHAQGRFRDMEKLARSLARRDAPPIINELLGMALCGQRRFADALAPLRDAAQAGRTDAQFWENLALCQRELGQLADAEQSLRVALSLRPFAAETLTSLGSILRS